MRQYRCFFPTLWHVKVMMMPIILFLQFVFLLYAPSAVSASPPPSAKPLPKSLNDAQLSQDQQQRIKSAVADAENKLDLNEAWKKKLFEEEALPEYQKFIRDYHSSASGIVVDVDLESLKNYLNFYGPTALKLPSAKLLVALVPEASCSKCKDAENEIRGLVKARVECRGMVPVWFRNDEKPGMSFQDYTTELTEMVPKKQAQGWILIQWGTAPNEDVDTAHADEVRYLISAAMKVSDFKKYEGKLELFDTGSFERSAVRLLTDSFTELGGEVGIEKQNLTASTTEVSLRVSGIRDFAHLNRIKNDLSLRLKTLGAVLEERRVFQGQVVFAVITSRSAEEVQKTLEGLELDPPATSESHSVLAKWEVLR